MHGSWGGYLPAFWSHASVHPDLFTTECLLYLRDGECATRRGLKSGRAVPQYAPRFGAAKWRAMGSPYFQACSIEARQALTLVPRGAARRREFCAMASRHAGISPLLEKHVASPWPRFACP